jgi:hypothetical protein
MASSLLTADPFWRIGLVAASDAQTLMLVIGANFRAQM